MEMVAAGARRDSVLALGAGLVAVVLWASAFVGIRSAGHDLSPGALTLGRLLIGSVGLGLVVMARREGLPRRRDLPGLVVCGLLWFGIYNVALNAAERLVDAGTAAMLVNVAPILTAVLAGLLLKEGFPRALFLGSGIAFSGVVVIAVATSKSGFAASWGALLCVAAAAASAGGIVAQKPLLSRASALQVTWFACTIGALACLPFAPTLVDQVRHANGSAVWWMIYLGTFPTALGFTAWAYGLAKSKAGRMASLTYLVPPLAILLGWAILGETPPELALVGGALCLGGVAIARYWTPGFLTRLRPQPLRRSRSASETRSPQ